MSRFLLSFLHLRGREDGIAEGYSSCAVPFDVSIIHKYYLNVEFQSNRFDFQASTSSSLPSFPSEIKKLSELTDGVGLCAVVSLYCPNELPWTEVALGEPPSMADSLYNIQVQLLLDIMTVCFRQKSDIFNNLISC